MNAVMPERADVQGWFNFEDYYWRIAQAVPAENAVLVELGPWMGLSTIFLAQSLQNLGKVTARIYAVDTWKGSPSEQVVFDYVISGGVLPAIDRFKEAIGRYKVDEMVAPMQMDSVQAATVFEDKSLDFVFVDTDHTEQQLSAELVAWLPKMKPGIFFGGHDIAVDGVRRAVEKNVKKWWVYGPCWEAHNA